jgi:hypothetical protein
VVRTGKTCHISANLGDEYFGGAASHARNRIQQVHDFFKRATDGLNLGIKADNGLVEAIDLTQQLRQHKAMMRFHLAFQGLRQLVPFAAQAAFGQLGQGLGVRITREQRRQDRPPRDPHDIRGHRRERDVGVFQEFCTWFMSIARSWMKVLR